MIKIYTGQNIESEDVISTVSEIQTTEQDWWFIYDADTKEGLSDPMQCKGFTSSPLTMIVSDSKEEIEQYITDNNITIKYSRKSNAPPPNNL